MLVGDPTVMVLCKVLNSVNFYFLLDPSSWSSNSSFGAWIICKLAHSVIHYKNLFRVYQATECWTFENFGFPRPSSWHSVLSGPLLRTVCPKLITNGLCIVLGLWSTCGRLDRTMNESIRLEDWATSLSASLFLSKWDNIWSRPESHVIQHLAQDYNR